MRKLLFTILIISISSAVQAQFDTDAVHLEYRYIPNSDLNNADARADLHTIDFHSYTPTIKIGSKTKINNMIAYRLYDYNFDSSNPVFNDYPDNLHQFKYMILIRHEINEHWDFYGAPRINIRTDLKRPFNSDDLFPSFTGMFVKSVIKDPRFKYGIGVNINNNNGKFRILPAAYFQYKQNDMKISAMIPSKANISWNKKKYAYSFGYTAESNLTHLNLPNDAVLNPDKVTYLRNMNIMIGPSYSKNLGSNIWVKVEAGITVSRLYEQYNDDYDEISEFYNDSFKPNAYFNIGFSYKVDSNKN